MVVASPPSACSRFSDQLSPPASAKTLRPASSISETWKCMPEPAYFSIGLAMKQAVTPCRRAAARTSRFSMTRSSAACSTSLR